MIRGLVLRGMHKHFGATMALDDAYCTVRGGTVHALLGENGAGKTTLMRIAFGMLTPDAGTIELDGRKLHLRSSADAITAGLGMVHQHFMLIPAMTVAENVALGGHGPFDARAAATRVREIGRETGLVLDRAARVRDLPLGAQQRLEIVKALAHDANILILDEPTAVLIPEEADELYAWLRRFPERGGTVVLITHKLREALEIADDVTVLRRGRTVLEETNRRFNERDVIDALVGDTSATAPEPWAGAPATAREPRADDLASTRRTVLALSGVRYVDEAGVTRLDDVTLSVASGDVLGVLGVEGAGQRELLRILAGRLEPTAGTVTRPARVGFIPEDRLHDALIPSMTLTENLALAEAGTRRGIVDWTVLRTQTREIIAALDLRAAGVDAPVDTLSGGNQQKFVVGRERAIAAEALVAENPTRGLDIRATERVRAEISALHGDPAPAVVFYSSDIDEVLAVATRVVVCYAGRVTEIKPSSDPDDRTPYTRALMGAR